MTTIAWDGKTLAADRRVSFDNTSDTKVTKIVKTKHGLCGTSGNTSLGAGFKRWFIDGYKGDPPPLQKDGESAVAFVIRQNGARFHYDAYGWYEAHPGPFAIGSGYELAIAAMESGKSAVEAVQIAAKFDGLTNDEIDTLEF